MSDSRTAHTHGPWVVGDLDRHGQRIVRQANIEVATCWHHSVGAIEREMEANARLIASAPCLLEALKYVMSAHGEQLTDAFDQAHRAIAKAEGSGTWGVAIGDRGDAGRTVETFFDAAGDNSGSQTVDVEALLARIAKRNGPDRDLDHEIAEALGGRVRRVSRVGLSGRTPGSYRVFWPEGDQFGKGSAVPYYTKDIKKASAKLISSLVKNRLRPAPHPGALDCGASGGAGISAGGSQPAQIHLRAISSRQESVNSDRGRMALPVVQLPPGLGMETMSAGSKTAPEGRELVEKGPWPDMPSGPVSILSRAGRARLAMLEAQHNAKLAALKKKGVKHDR